MLKERYKATFLYQVPCLAEPHYLNECIKYINENELIPSDNDNHFILKGIKQLTREKSYNRINIHKNRDLPKERSNRGEEWFVLDLFFNKIEHSQEIFGKIIDYQVPLKNKRSDKGYGKFDFIYEKHGKLYLAELKANYSKESILKAIIEIQTYYQQANLAKLLTDYELEKDTEIRKVVIVFKGTPAADEYHNCREVKILAEKLDVEIIVIDEKRAIVSV